MVAPVIAGAAIGAGSSLLGGLLGRESGASQQRRNLDAQREFAQHGVRWKVEDARAAGLHPLYAMGASTSSPAVSVMDDPLGRAVSDAGQSVSRAVMAQETQEQREARELGLAAQKVAMQRDLAQANYWDAMAAKARQEATQSKPFPSAGGGSGINLDPFRRGSGENAMRDIIAPQGDKVISSRTEDPSVTAGVHSGFQEHVITPFGLKMRLPRSDEGPAEAWGELSWYDKLGMIAHNMNYYGTEWGGRFLKEFLWGKPPEFRVAPREMERSYREQSFRSRGGRSTGGYQRGR